MATVFAQPRHDELFEARTGLMEPDTSNSSSETRRISSTTSRSEWSSGSSVSGHNHTSPNACPPCPYVVGFSTTAVGHEPPNPFGSDYTTRYPDQTLDPAHMSQQEFCFSTSPLPGRILSNHTMALKITSIIRIGAHTGAQVVVVNHSLVAKIYDPMYYDSSEYSDVVRSADRDYSREAAAYSHLRQFPEVAEDIPAFHGTWTIDVKSTSSKEGGAASRSRTVRLILLEHLQGRCMAAIDPHTLSEPARSTILKQCINAEIRILHTGVAHRDLAPRNIILMGTDYKTPNIQVKVIDFNVCELFAHPTYTDQEYVRRENEFYARWAPKLVSPVKRYFCSLDDFVCDGWCLEDEDERNNWLWETFGHDQRYIPVKWDPNDPGAYPRYVDEKGHTDDPAFPDFESDEEET